MALLGRFSAFLRGRGLFKNWFWAGVKYMLIKYGLARGNVDVTFRCGVKARLSPLIYSWFASAYRDGLLNLVSCSNGTVYLSYGYGGRVVEVGLRSGDVFTFRYLGRDVVLFLNGFSDAIFDVLFENFLGGAYDDLSVDGRVVVDVGAGVGDTAILFALRGASRVIALEPYPALYSIALRNIELNNVKGSVILLNAGLGSSDYYACGGYEAPSDYAVFRPSDKCDVKVRIYTPESLIKELGIDDAVLKMDCEGCEYEVFRSMKPETIRRFRELIIEYHNGPEPMASMLENHGYEVTIKPIRSADIPINKQGYILATIK